MFKSATKLKILGYFLFGVSFLLLGVIAVLPFLIQDLSKMLAINTVLVLVSESSFALSILILGKEFWINIKLAFGNIFSKLVKQINDKH
jgi:hypothetical protein